MHLSYLSNESLSRGSFDGLPDTKKRIQPTWVVFIRGGSPSDVMNRSIGWSTRYDVTAGELDMDLEVAFHLEASSSSHERFCKVLLVSIKSSAHAGGFEHPVDGL